MGLIIALSSIILIWGVKNFLAGKGAPEEIRNRIRKTVLLSDEVKAIRELKTIYLGSEKLLLHLDIEISESMNVRKIEEVIEMLKKNIKKEVKEISFVQIETYTS